MKRTLLPFLILALWFTAQSQAPAQQTKVAVPLVQAPENKPAEDAFKPVVVLSIGSYDRLLADAAMLGNLGGNPDLDKNVEEMLKLFTQNQGLAGLDRNRPWGITLMSDGIDFQPLVFLPVINHKQLLEALVPLIGDPQDVGQGVQSLSVLGIQVFVKEQKGWAYVAQSPFALVNLPQDPTKYLGALDKSYDIALRAYVQNIPEMYRSLAVDQLKLGVESGLNRDANETEQEFAARKKIAEDQLNTLVTTITEIDQLTLGLGFDVVGKSALVDISVSAVPGSKTAAQMAAAQPMSSEFAGFLVPGSAASLNVMSKIEKQESEQVLAALQAARTQAVEAIAAHTKDTDPATAKLAADIVGEVFDALRKTVESGKMDLGLNVNMSGKSLAVVAGAYVADPSGLEGSLKKFADWAAKTEKGFPGIKFDADKHHDVRFHTTSLPVPKEELISKVLGEKLELAIGIGPKSIYVAVGSDSLNLAKQLIDKSRADAGKVLPPTQLNVSLGPIIEFASALDDNQPGLKAMAAELAKAKGKDRISLVTVPQPPASSASTIRLELQEAVLRALISGVKSAAGMEDTPLPINIQ